MTLKSIPAVLEDATLAAGWNEERVIRVLLDFIELDLRSDPRKFETYIRDEVEASTGEACDWR